MRSSASTRRVRRSLYRNGGKRGNGAPLSRWRALGGRVVSGLSEQRFHGVVGPKPPFAPFVVVLRACLGSTA
jgi:hypothetical protein